MKKNSKDSLFSPDAIFLVQWGDTHLKHVSQPDIECTNNKDKACVELKITDYYIPIRPN